MKTIKQLGISPIPWTKDGDIVDDNEGRVIFNAYEDDDYANARLIAAAPELYEALYKITKEQECGQDCIKCTNHGCVIKECKAALAKAAGESEVE